MGNQLVVIEFHRPVICLQNVNVTSVRMFNVTSLVYTLERDRGQNRCCERAFETANGDETANGHLKQQMGNSRWGSRTHDPPTHAD